jgi:hypothetical protein
VTPVGAPVGAADVAAVDGPGAGAEEAEELDEGEDEHPAATAAIKARAVAANPRRSDPRRSDLRRSVISAIPPCGLPYTALLYNREIMSAHRRG